MRKSGSAQQELKLSSENKFVAKLRKLGTTSAKWLILHYVEGDRYSLTLLNRELNLKVSKDVYSELLRNLDAPRIIITVDKNEVCLVESDLGDLKPYPQYLLRVNSNAYIITSSGKIVVSLANALSEMKYHSWHTYLGERHEIHPKDMLRQGSISFCSCGCCADLILSNYFYCEKCYRTINVAGKLLGYWLASKEDIEGAFYLEADSKEIALKTDEKLVKRPVKEVVQKLVEDVSGLLQ
jgi:hypothetical protein